MTKATVPVAAVLLCCLIGCESGALRQERIEMDRMSRIDRELVQAHQDVGIRRAIIAQHTLYPYHFVAGAADLNDLGQHDLAVLAEHYKDNPGPLNVRRGSAPDELYKARVASVTAAIANAGVQRKIAVSDTLPGGQDMPSEKVINILQAEEKERQKQGAGTMTETTFTTKGVTY